MLERLFSQAIQTQNAYIKLHKEFRDYIQNNFCYLTTKNLEYLDSEIFEELQFFLANSRKKRKRITVIQEIFNVAKTINYLTLNKKGLIYPRSSNPGFNLKFQLTPSKDLVRTRSKENETIVIRLSKLIKDPCISQERLKKFFYLFDQASKWKRTTKSKTFRKKKRKGIKCRIEIYPIDVNIEFYKKGNKVASLSRDFKYFLDFESELMDKYPSRTVENLELISGFTIKNNLSKRLKLAIEFSDFIQKTLEECEKWKKIVFEQGAKILREIRKENEPFRVLEKIEKS